MKIPIEVSARHIHLSKEHLEILFGEGYALKYKKELFQPNQYACYEKVDLVGEKGRFNITILAPLREDTQVELSMTDARKIGVVASLRDSGDIRGTQGALLRGPQGSVVISKGIIVAKRHVHLSDETAKKWGLIDREIVNVEIAGERALVFNNVTVRVDKTYLDSMHIDTDEVNAAGVDNGSIGTIVKLS
jgi:putative phosphotransacetylase